ncbi:MAG TPA: DUF664 domain-containing protein [Planctomycetota bacterium]|nr:DUF664 domain-containing protein [Planctomycetota bacterium]
MSADADALAAELARAFRTRVVEECLPRIGRCLDLLDERQIWHRPAPHCNAIGNLVLHLAGNVRQWIVSGIGGAPDERDRAAEFHADGADAPRKDELFARLAASVHAAEQVVARLDPGALLAVYPFQQGRFPDKGIAGVVHVIEHFSGHAYQIYDRTKQLTGRDLRFYDL